VSISQFSRLLCIAHLCFLTCRLNGCITNICDCDGKFALHLTRDGWVANRASCIAQQQQ